MQQDTLLFASEKSAVTIPVDKINLCEKVGAYYIIAWSSFPAVILPESAAQSPETAALLRRIESAALPHKPIRPRRTAAGQEEDNKMTNAMIIDAKITLLSP